MEWSHDFCLACDRQIPEGPYCSQACRLADLEKAGASEPSSPSTTESWTSPGFGAGTGLYLPPALDFSAYRSPTRVESPPTSPSSTTSTVTHFPQLSRPTLSSALSSPALGATLPRRRLSPSSSRSSLSSIRSTPSTQGLSDQAKSQLRDYLSSFDQVRDWKRRCTLA